MPLLPNLFLMHQMNANMSDLRNLLTESLY